MRVSFSNRRRVRGEQAEINRLYVAEPTPSITGSMADHRVAIAASRIAITGAGSGDAASASSTAGGEDAQELAPYEAWIDTVTADLQEHRGSSLVFAGEYQPPQVHALAHAINQRLGNVGNTIVYSEPVEEQVSSRAASLPELVRDMAQGRVEVLLILGANPVFTAPADLGFRDALSPVPFRAHFGEYEDETSGLCEWHVPQAHFLETWSDSRSFDGTATIMQPLIAPLYGGKSPHEVMAILTGSAETSSYDIVRAFWRAAAVTAILKHGGNARCTTVSLPTAPPPLRTVSVRAPSSAPRG